MKAEGISQPDRGQQPIKEDTKDQQKKSEASGIKRQSSKRKIKYK